MIHVVRLGIDSAGRSSVDSRVLDVDPADGLNQASRINSAIDVMRTATTDAEAPAAVCIAVRPGEENADLHRGTGRRRRVRVIDENRAVVRYLTSTGLLAPYESVMVVDCGDSGMTMFTTTPAGADVSDVVRTPALSGVELDKRIAQTIAEPHGWGRRPTAEQVTACRTAKEELFTTEARPASGQVKVSVDDVERAAGPLIEAAAAQVSEYVQRRPDGGPQVVIVVGGLAHIPQIVDELGQAAGVPALAAPSPELAGALGAALTAREADSGITKLTTIGGRRNRDWLSTVPLVVVGAAVGVIAMSMYAGGALTRTESPFVPEGPTSPAVSDASILTTRTTVDDNVSGEATLTPDTPRDGEGPGWRTTALNPTTPGRTRTLVPTTLPTDPRTTPSTSDSSSTTSSPALPFVPSGIPLPPNLIPSGLLPSPSPAPQPQNAPRDEGREPSTTPPKSATPRSAAPRPGQAGRHHRSAPPSSTPRSSVPPEAVPQR